MIGIRKAGIQKAGIQKAGIQKAGIRKAAFETRLVSHWTPGDEGTALEARSYEPEVTGEVCDVEATDVADDLPYDRVEADALEVHVEPIESFEVDGGADLVDAVDTRDFFADD